MTAFACTDNPELLSVEHNSEDAFVRLPSGEALRIAGHPVVSSEVFFYPEATLTWDDHDGIEGDD